jgi:peroxiredoxin
MKPDLITPGELAPDFELTDTQGNSVRLSDCYKDRVILLAFLRGFL